MNSPFLRRWTLDIRIFLPENLVLERKKLFKEKIEKEKISKYGSCIHCMWVNVLSMKLM